MNTLLQHRHNHTETSLAIKVSRGTQRNGFHYANGVSFFAFYTTAVGHFLRSNVGNDFEVLLRGERPHKSVSASDTAHTFYQDIRRVDSVVSLATRLLCCFPFLSRLKSGEIIPTGQYMNYQTISKVQFRPLLKNFFLSIHIDLRGTSGGKNSFVSVR